MNNTEVDKTDKSNLLTVDEQNKYNLDNYPGKNSAEQALHAIHALFSSDPNAELSTLQKPDGSKVIIINETDGHCSMINCSY